MATTLTILANDFSVAGVQAAGGQQFTFTPVNILFSTAAQSVVSRKQFTLTTGATGSGSTLIPDSVAGNGLRIDSSLNGWTSVTVANYPTGAISLPRPIHRDQPVRVSCVRPRPGCAWPASRAITWTGSTLRFRWAY